MHSLLESNKFYYHPFTKVKSKPPVVDILPDGQILEQRQGNFQIKFKDKLTAEDIANYFYLQIGLPHSLQDIKRDCGGVNYLIKNCGIDIILFAIDCLCDDFHDSEHRSDHYPSLLEAKNFMQEADDRLGIAKQIAKQYGVDEDAFFHYLSPDAR